LNHNLDDFGVYMLNLENKEIRFTIDTVAKASQLVKTVQEEMVTPALTKGDRSPVTVADYAAQALVGNLLEEGYPADAMIGEEDSTELRNPRETKTLERITAFVSRYSPAAKPKDVCRWIDRGSSKSAHRYWTLDPIDGTKGFLRGDQYAIAFALVFEGKVQIGALGCPELTLGEAKGVILVAARGLGTWLGSLAGYADGDYGFRQVRVSHQADPTHARLLRSFESGHTNVSQVDILADELGVCAGPVRMDSQAKYAVLAAGHGEIYLRLLSSDQPDYREKIWDQAAGSIIIEEAGGRVTDLDGKDLDFTLGRTLAHNRGICATNGVLHERTLDALRTIHA
jgi:3'(2'), 5'-bisphosphate nucleotidase